MPLKSEAATFRNAVREINKIKEIAAAISAGDFSEFDQADLTSRYTRLEHHKSKLEGVFYEILDGEDLSDAQEDTYTKNYESAIGVYNEVLAAFERLKPSSALPSTSQQSTSSISAAVLPNISLPNFSSQVEDWPSFIAIFKSLTDDMSTLSDAVKLHYLLSCLSGEARSMVSHLQLTNDNFSVAMDILTRRYENRRVLIDRFVDIILGLPDIHARSAIRTSFLTPLISAQSALCNLDLPMKGSDYVFVSIVVRKLKGELRTLFERKYGSSSTLPTLKDLIAFLEEHARCIETEWSNTAPPLSPRHSPQPSPPRRQSPNAYAPRTPARQPAAHQFRPIAPPRGQADYRSTQPAQYSRTYSAQPDYRSAHPAQNAMACPYCKGRGHKLIACPRYNNEPIQGRWDFVNARNRCRRCLGPHYENECKSTRACKECGSARHHTSLHRPGTPSPQHSSAHLLPEHLREQPRQRSPQSRLHPSAHATQAPARQPNSPPHSRSPSRSHRGSQQ